MDSTVTEIANDVFRINIAPAADSVSFSYFLIRDEQPAMVETGFDRLFGMYDAVRNAVSRLIDPTALRYIFVPHVESDECGSIQRFLDLAPECEALVSPIGASVTIEDMITRPARALRDGERISLGRKTLTAVATPWVHMWDSMLVHDETDRVLFTSDLFGQPGAGPAIQHDDVSAQIVELARVLGLLPSQAHLLRALDRIERLPVDVIACHHGSVLAGDPGRYYRALRENPVGDVMDAPMYTAVQES